MIFRTLATCNSLCNNLLPTKSPKNILGSQKLIVKLVSKSLSKYKMPQDYLNPLKQNQKRFARIMFLKQLYEEKGFEIRIAGGAVRDIVRGQEPQDIDFATTAKPDQSLELLSQREDILRIIVTSAGQRHGTVAVKFKETDSLDFSKRIKLDSDSYSKKYDGHTPKYDDESPFEITTLRCDKVTDGRHAEVEFITDWKLDAERRDLTINAMFLTLDGELIDFYGGKNDLEKGIIRFVGNADKRISEDYLRILRFFRFWARYGNQRPNEDTLMSIRNGLVGMKSVSGERLWAETKKIFSHLPCSHTIKLILELKVQEQLGIIDSDIEYSKYIDEALNELKMIEANLAAFDKEYPNDQSTKKTKELFPVIAFSSLLQTNEMLVNAYARMKFSNLEKDLLILVMKEKNTLYTIKELKFQLGMAKPSDVYNHKQKLRAFLIYKGNIELLAELDKWDVPVFPLKGNIVSAEFNKRRLPSKGIQNVMSELRLLWVKSDFQLTQEELIEKIVETISKDKK